MKITYLFSSQNGDIHLEPKDLSRPFLATPSEAHPFLTLKDYFQSIEAFILTDQAKPMLSVLRERLKRDINLDDIQEILIRSEKHGVLYHLASAELWVATGHRVRLAVNTAISMKGKKWLTQEYELLKYLNSSLNLPYLPDTYFKGEIVVRAGKKEQEILAMFSSEWFEGYHEWHLSIDEADKQQKILIWDLHNGYRWASQEEAFEIFRQTAKILTLYYDTTNFKQIYPWHHAAGDFIVKIRNGNVDVKLTPARRYEPIMAYFTEVTVNPMIALIYFFLNLTVKIRLDKLDGVGTTVWAGNFALDAAAEGFFEALGMMEAAGRYRFGQIEDLRSLLKSFDEKEFERLFQSLFSIYEKDDPSDLTVIRANLKSHIRQLYILLHGFHL